MTWPVELRIVPVVTLHDATDAVPLARALADGGLPVVELTMRTPAGLQAVERIRDELPDVLCGIGTLLSAADVDRAVAAGAQFLVSPGSTDSLLDAMAATGLTCLPGAATASEAMRVMEHGFSLAKFFPAETAGGARALASLAAPLAALRWCATGGITATNAASYLALPHVAAVGGSWMVPDAAVTTRDWDTVRRLAAQAHDVTRR